MLLAWVRVGLDQPKVNPKTQPKLKFRYKCLTAINFEFQVILKMPKNKKSLEFLLLYCN